MSQRNIVVILCDQLRPDFLSLYGCSAIPTPNLDRLAKLGVVFDNAISASPVCGPARASMMTGLYPSTHGVWTNNLPFRDNLDYLAVRMNALDYATACFGKLHHYPPRDTKGFQYARQLEGGRLKENEPYLQWLRCRHPGITDFWNCDREKHEFKLSAEDHYEYWIASETISYIETAASKSDQPFFLWVSFQGPHTPWNPPPEIKGACNPESFPPPIKAGEGAVCPIHTYRKVWNPFPFQDLEDIMQVRAAYGDTMANIDVQIGRILGCLDERGLFDDTTFVFSSDHGDLLGDFGQKAKGPFPYQGQLAVPLVVANHPSIPEGVRTSNLAGNLDIPATVLDVAGDEKGIGLSRSLLDLSREEPENPRDMNFSELGDTTKIVENSRYRYCLYPFAGFSQLFDRWEDPQERINLAGNPKYSSLEIEFLKELNAFSILCKGVEIPGYNLIPPVQEELRKRHPHFDDPDHFRAAYPLNKWHKQRLKEAGLDPTYTDFYQHIRVSRFMPSDAGKGYVAEGGH